MTALTDEPEDRDPDIWEAASVETDFGSDDSEASDEDY